MGDFAQVVEAERSAAALDRMRGAENRIQVFGVRIGHIESQQQAFHFGQMFFCFIKEHLMEPT